MRRLPTLFGPQNTPRKYLWPERNLCAKHFLENWQYLTPTDRLSDVPVFTKPILSPQVLDKVTQTPTNTRDEHLNDEGFNDWTTERIQCYLEEFYFYGTAAFDQDQILDEYKEEFAKLTRILEQRKTANLDHNSMEEKTAKSYCPECHSPCLSNNFCSKCSSAKWEKVHVYHKVEEASQCLMEMRERFTNSKREAVASRKHKECDDKDKTQVNGGRLPHPLSRIHT
jgi:hypothetical protein